MRRIAALEQGYGSSQPLPTSLVDGVDTDRTTSWKRMRRKRYCNRLLPYPRSLCYPGARLNLFPVNRLFSRPKDAFASASIKSSNFLDCLVSRLPPRTMGRMTLKSTRRVLGHSLLRSLVRSHRSLIRLLRTARFARALRCAHSFACSLTRSLQSSWESGLCL